MNHIDQLARYAGAEYRPASSLVGEYLFWPDSKRSITMCIDSHDSGTVTNPTLLETSDIYVKTNYWKDTCDPRVIPFFNCNPIVIPYISKLKAMRNQQFLYDFSFIVRVWGGKTGTDGVEHCIQLLEALAKVRAKKFLLAELVVGDTSEQARRLRSSGIPSTTRRLPLNDLWDIAATSRVNVFRLGNHQCLSWRMTDLFALGACIALDQEPKTQWPVPLVHNQHYCSLGATTPYDEPVATVDRYGAIPIDSKNCSETANAMRTCGDRLRSTLTNIYIPSELGSNYMTWSWPGTRFKPALMRAYRNQIMRSRFDNSGLTSR